jgi:hypothetical protein
MVVRFERVVALAMVCGGLASGCASYWKRDVEACAKFAVGDWTPYDSPAAASLAGRYDLILISEDASTFSRSIRGPLELAVADSAHLIAPSDIGATLTVDRGPLWGWSNLDGDRIGVPWLRNPLSRNPAQPAIVVSSAGIVELRAGSPPHGEPVPNSAWMSIDRVARGGFSGTWYGYGSAPKRDASNDLVPDVHGRFCALRR